MNSEATPKEELNKLLGLYKAEWLNGQLFELFTEPGYFDDLTTKRPCVLMGGRGTGKTTVLKGLSYLGQLARAHGNKKEIETWPFYGLYYRVNTNRVTAFRGSEISDEKWIAVFAHYLNLLFCRQLFDFCSWFESETKLEIQIPSTSLEGVAKSLGLNVCTTIHELSKSLEVALVEFEASINTIADRPPNFLSMQAAPLDQLSKALTAQGPLQGKQFFFLLDEFENFENYQQRVVNTIVKHASDAYTFKVGVRELGLRERATLNSNEQLVHPADYALINISDTLSDSRFEVFATQVIDGRISRAYKEGTTVGISIASVLPRLSEAEEADLLLDPKFKVTFLESVSSSLTPAELASARDLSASELYFISYWSKGKNHGSAEECLRSRLRDSAEWQQRTVNNFYASLFAIKVGKVGIRKYYCGWDVFLLLANGNIRYLLELVHRAVALHFEQNKELLTPISPDTQTIAAQQVGRRNLQELEGLSVDGAKLTKLALSLGRVFQVMAEDPAGHTPEANQFYLPKPSTVKSVDDQVKRILDHAVMHQALVRYRGSKALDSADTREYDYALHPIFSPFFIFSHRKKRKLALESHQILDLIERPQETIRAILRSNNREPAKQLPDQLALFSSFYE